MFDHRLSLPVGDDLLAGFNGLYFRLVLGRFGGPNLEPFALLKVEDRVIEAQDGTLFDDFVTVLDLTFSELPVDNGKSDLPFADVAVELECLAECEPLRVRITTTE